MKYKKTLRGARGGINLDSMSSDKITESVCKQCGGELESHQALTQICTACFRESQRETRPVIRTDSLKRILSTLEEQ